MTNAELIKALRCCGSEDERHEMCVDESYRCPIWNEDRMTDYCKADLMNAAADALEAAEKRIAELEDELRFQLDTRRKETAEIERLKAENLKLQKQNRDCGWNCKQCEYVDKDL